MLFFWSMQLRSLVLFHRIQDAGKIGRFLFGCWFQSWHRSLYAYRWSSHFIHEIKFQIFAGSVNERFLRKKNGLKKSFLIKILKITAINSNQSELTVRHWHSFWLQYQQFERESAICGPGTSKSIRWFRQRLVFDTLHPALLASAQALRCRLDKGNSNLLKPFLMFN